MSADRTRCVSLHVRAAWRLNRTSPCMWRNLTTVCGADADADAAVRGDTACRDCRSRSSGPMWPAWPRSREFHEEAARNARYDFQPAGSPVWQWRWRRPPTRRTRLTVLLTHGGSGLAGLRMEPACCQSGPERAGTVDRSACVVTPRADILATSDENDLQPRRSTQPHVTFFATACATSCRRCWRPG